MQSAPIIEKVKQPFGKLAGWLMVMVATKYLTNGSELDSFATQLGLNGNAISELLNGIGSSKITDYYKEIREASSYRDSQDLQNVFDKAIDSTVDILVKDFKLQNSIFNKEQQQIELFFKSVAFQIKELDFSSGIVRQYVEQPTEFFKELWHIISNNALEPNITEETSQQLCAFLAENFEQKFQYYLIDSLKNNDHAKTEYFIQLLECAAQTNYQNKQTLDLIIETLDSISRDFRQSIDVVRRTSHAQSLIYEHYRKLTTKFSQFVKDNQNFRDRILDNFEPSLYIPDLRFISIGHQFQFGARFTTFIGREDILNDIWKFFRGQQDRKFLWWMITGQGGMGKSRLALEFCLEAKYLKNHVGFLEYNDVADFTWRRWRPQYPTLLIIDYVATYQEAVRSMLAELSRSDQNNNFNVPIRVLLLEREVGSTGVLDPAYEKNEVVNNNSPFANISRNEKTPEGWWNQWINDPNLIVSSYYKGEPQRILELPAFSETDSWNIIEEIHQKQGKSITSSPLEVLRKLKELDPNQRPLFAFFVGMALADGQDIRSWNVHQLLDNLLNREENKIWRRHNQYNQYGESHKNLLLITTLARGLWDNQMQEILLMALQGLPKNCNNALYEQMGRVIYTTATNKKTIWFYEGLQPDLVGEYFILRHIKHLLLQLPHGKIILKELIEMTWHPMFPQAWWMLWQTYRDFPEGFSAEVYEQILLTKPPHTANIYSWQLWSNLAFNLIDLLSKLGQIENAEIKYREIESSLYRFPSDPHLAVKYAQSAFAINIYYINSKNYLDSERKSTDLKKIQQKLSEIVIIGSIGVMNSFNMISFYLVLLKV